VNRKPRTAIRDLVVVGDRGAILDKHPHTGEIVTHLDRDFPGSKMTVALRECLQGRCKFTDAPPTCGKDINDQLMAKRNKDIC